MFDSKHHGRILILSIKTIFMTTTRPGIELAIRPLDSVWNSGLKSRKERPNPCRNDWDRSDWYNNLRPFLFPPSNREGGGRKMSPFTSKNGGGVIFWWIEKNNFWGGGGKYFFLLKIILSPRWWGRLPKMCHFFHFWGLTVWNFTLWPLLKI